MAGTTLPLPFVKELQRLKSGEVTLHYNARYVAAVAADTTLFVRLIEGDFPETSKVIPKTTAFKLTTDRKGLIAAFKGAQLCASDRLHVVRLTINGTLELHAENPDSGAVFDSTVEYSEREAVKGGGDPVTLGINARYVLQALHAIESREVTLEGVDFSTPITIKSADDTRGAALIMPMRL